MRKILILLFIALSFYGFGQVKDSTNVTIDTSSATVLKTKIEVTKAGGNYLIKQFNGDNIYTQISIADKKTAINTLTDMLKRVKIDEANLLRELAITRARKNEIKNARDVYK